MAVESIGVTAAVTNSNTTAYTVPPNKQFRFQNMVCSTQVANDNLSMWISSDATIDDADLIWDRVIFPVSLPMTYEPGCVVNANERIVLRRAGAGTVNVRLSGILEDEAGPSA